MAGRIVPPEDFGYNTIEKQRWEKLAERVDPKGFVELASYGYHSLLLNVNNDLTPFVVAYGYNRETGEWSHGTYFADAVQAFCQADPDVIEESLNVWRRTELAEEARRYGLSDDALVEQAMAAAGFEKDGAGGRAAKPVDVPRSQKKAPYSVAHDETVMRAAAREQPLSAPAKDKEKGKVV